MTIKTTVRVRALQSVSAHGLTRGAEGDMSRQDARDNERLGRVKILEAAVTPAEGKDQAAK